MSQRGVIDGLQFARGAESLEGRLDLSQLPRLAGMKCSTEGLVYEVRGRSDAESRSWLRILVSGSLVLVCQRCLGPLAFSIALDNELLLAWSEREIAEADDDIDRVLAGNAMPVGELVEDEVILALPMVSRHEQCDARQGRDANRVSPFAALAKLKRTQ